ncbi:Alpha/Beta hydrolase protein, partial [Leptodontidium sp. 2 PMI_412]
SIVAVHGLGGDAVNTWTHPKSKAFWLKDFLPLQIPDERIMTFGYNANAAFGQSTAELIDHAKSLLTSLVVKREEREEVQRPLIFIAHSLGGIVVKQALLQARLEPRCQAIKEATLGLIFLGTPHRGSDKATYGKVLANVAQFMSHRPQPRLLTALQTNSDVLLRLTSDFRFQLSDYQVYSFFELRPMKGSRIVEKHSALLETNHEEQIPVDADHSTMCKFETEADDTFEKVYKRVKRMKNTPRRVANEQLGMS